MRGLKQFYNYGNENLPITDLLEKPEIVNYLERNRPLTHASKREKLRETLREHGDNLQELVTYYNLQNPPPPQQRQQEVHINNITKKISSGISALKRVRPFIDRDTAVKAYKGLVEPYFTYARQFGTDLVVN